MNVTNNTSIPQYRHTGMVTPKPLRRAGGVPPTPRLSKRKRSAATTPSRGCCFPLVTPDRFIPNRSLMDTSRVQASLRKKASCLGTTGNDYETQLRRALWGSNKNSSRGESISSVTTAPPLMTFGSRQNCSKRSRVSIQEDHPYRQDVLRPQQWSSRQAEKPRRRQVSIDFVKGLTAPDILQDDDLHVVDQGAEYLAMALGDTVYVALIQDGLIEVLEQNFEDLPYSSVKWSNDGHWLAVGTANSVSIYNPAMFDDPIYEFNHHNDFVTAIVWKGTELLVACRRGITKYDFSRHQPWQALCERRPVYTRIQALEWRDNIIASADTDGNIQLFDSNIEAAVIKPRRSIRHLGVNSLCFYPHSDILISGGHDGLRLWNVWSGELRASIPMDEPVKSVICSSVHNQNLLVATARSISVWTVRPSPEKIAEEVIEDNAEILNMIEATDGTLLCANSNDTVSKYSITGCKNDDENENNCRADGVGRLQMPVIR